MRSALFLFKTMQIIQKNKKSNFKAFSTKIVVGLFLVTLFAANSAAASEISVDNVIKLVNEARKAANIEALVKNESLQKAAEKKAQNMLDDNYFAHVAPDGKTPWFWIENEGYIYRFAGENLAINFTNAEDEQKAWMDSELHRKNILNPEYLEIGVAIKKGVIDGQKTTIAVQMFGAKFPVAAASVAMTNPQLLKENIVPVATALKNDDKAKEFKGSIDFELFYQDNKLVVDAWLVALGIAIMITIPDLLAVFHKKQKQFTVLHDIENRHV